MDLTTLLAFEDYKEGLKALYERYDLTLGYKDYDASEEETIQYLNSNYGWNTTELWNLDDTITRFLVSRLYVFYKLDDSTSQEFEEGSWGDILKSILEGLLMMLYTKEGFEQPNRDEKIINDATMLLGKYFRRLWN
jgi:hypothetical protein